jgi:DUF4097 and DUF4098 domain-containing protein YvlB
MPRLLNRTTFLLLALAIGFSFLAAPVSADELVIERTLALDTGGVLDLETDSGRVEIRGTSRNDVLVVVRAKNDETADRYDFSFEEQGDRAVVRVKKRRGLARRWFSWNDGLEFEIEVPRITDLQVRTSGGRIQVEDIDGAADLHTSGGGIELESISGIVEASTSGGSISGVDLGASADLSTSGGGISVEALAGDLRAETSGGSITIKDAGGKVDADTSGGSITAYFGAGNNAGGSLSTSGGRIVAYIDPDASFDLQASSSGGGVTVDLPVTVQGKVSRRSVRGQINGGGATLRLHTSGGGVSLRPL